MTSKDWHALVGLGTDGGQPLVDGDRLAGGVHLLWSIRPELGFPVDGYHVWRRRHREPEWSCLDPGNGLLPPPGTSGTDWEWLDYRVRVDPGPVTRDPDACGEAGALYLPGSRSVEVRPPRVAAAVRVVGVGALPVLEVLVASGGGTAVALRLRARRAGGGRWAVQAWADGIVGARVLGEDLRVCGFCFGYADEAGGWDKLREVAILLPVVEPRTANDAAHLHGDAPTRREAAARLSATLPADTRERLARTFARDLGVLAGNLLRQGRGASLPDTATAAADVRTPPTLGMSTGGLLALAAIDPDIARMLGLYWHDPVTGGIWDYKVVAHHGPVRYPGPRVTFDDLAAGPVGSGLLVHRGIRFVGNAGLRVLPADPASGTPPALRVQPPRAGTVVGIRLDPPVPALTLRFTGPAVVFTAWRAGTPVDVGVALFDLIELTHAPGIDAVTWTAGPVDLHEVEQHSAPGMVLDLVAYAWHLSPDRPDPVRDLELTAAAAAETTRLNPDGTVGPDTGVVGLDWSAPNHVPDVHQPIRVLVARADRADAAGDFAVRNAAAPALAFARSPRLTGARPGPDIPRRWTDHDVPAGRYAWRVRGVDAFGRLGEWSAERVVEVAPDTRPPVPEGVAARYLDPADPGLSDGDRALVEADGAGLLVEWSWPAGRRVQAPRVEPHGEFRVLLRRGDPDRLDGVVSGVRDLGAASRLDTDLRWDGPADALAGELLRQRGASFEITGNGTGPHAWVRVRQLAAPTRRPIAGGFTIRLVGAGRTDLGDPRAFDRRVCAEPVGRIVRHTTRIASAVAAGDDRVDVTLADPLPPAAAGTVSGYLVSGAVAHRVTRQTPGAAAVEVLAGVQPDGSAVLPAVGGAGTVWPGAVYRAWLPGCDLTPRGSEALAVSLVAVTTSDGDPSVADDPVWDRPGRGGLGGRPGRESRASPVARVSVPGRTAPAPVAVVLPAERDGDIPADRAEPADWYGRARYTLAFPLVAGAAGYRVLRTGAAALFLRDRTQRQSGTGPYAAGPFDDGGASADWLAANYPALTEADLTANPATQPNPEAVRAAWRGWTAWYYPRLLNKEVMALAERPGNEEAFRPAHDGTVPAPPWRDTIDGRGLGRFVYRVRTVDASGNTGAWSAAFPLVEVHDVTPPAPPVMLSALGDERAVVLTWLRGGEPDLAAYRVWRAERAGTLADVRRRPVHAEVVPAGDGITVTWRDEGMVGLADRYYRVAAVDTAGNVSAPTAVLKARPVDTGAPDPPKWTRAERVKRRGSDGALLPPEAPEDPAEVYTAAVAFAWTVAEDGVTCMLERRLSGERLFTARTGWLEPTGGDRRFAGLDDDRVDPARAAVYRVRARDAAGNEQRYAWNPVAVAPAGGGR